MITNSKYILSRKRDDRTTELIVKSHITNIRGREQGIRQQDIAQAGACQHYQEETNMNISLTETLDNWINEQVESGLYTSSSEVIEKIFVY